MSPTRPGKDAPVLPRSEDKRAVVEAMFDRIAGDYERVNRVISLHLDRHWRRRAVERLGLAPGSLVLDLACGTGDMSRILRAKGHMTMGFDFSHKMLRYAKGADALVRADVCALPVVNGMADGVVCGFALRNLVDIAVFFSECARVLRPGGRLAVLDAATPQNPLVRPGHRLWFGRVVPWLGARMSEPVAYRYLSASTAYLPAPAALVATARDTGLSHVEVTGLTFGAVWLITASKP